MKVSDVKDIAMLVMMAGIAYAIYRIFKSGPGGEPGGILDTLVAAPIAAVYNAATLPGDVEVLGKVRMPGGVLISMGQIRVNDLLQFTYNGRKYKLIGRNGDVYTAEVAT